MAAYAALVSLMHIIDQIRLHPRPPISLDEKQVESLTEKVTFLQEFLEGYSHVGYGKGADDLESRIVDAAYAAEDIIETHIVDGLESRIVDAAYAAEDITETHVVDQILAGSTSHGEKINSVDFYEGLQKVIEDMDSIKKEVMEIKEKMEVQDKLQRSSTTAGSLRSSSTGQNITMVGFDDVFNETMDKLIGQQSGCQIIPIVGMGGIGKTTLARNIYANQHIKEHFDICAWVTVSQEYNTRELLNQVLSEVNKGRRDLGEMNEDVLGDMLYKYLWGRRYLIVMDDMWDIEAWDTIKRFFPDNNSEGRIVITTRLSNLASELTSSNGLQMKFLDDINSWKLLSKIVFGEEVCPPELEEIGRKIAKSCKGLPLSIVVIGGLLTKHRQTREYWEHIRENLNSVVNSEDNERGLQVLHLSYKQLPVYLKSCFLYMGVFSEDEVIRASSLIKLWVAEGFLKPASGKSLEEISKEYLMELIERNLILVHKLGSTGNIKFCKIHDLLRDFCLREAQKERFYNVIRQRSLNVSEDIKTQRRIVIHDSTSREKVIDALQSMSLTRSLISDELEVLPSLNFRLLRIFNMWRRDKSGRRSYTCYQENVFKLVNLRYLAVSLDQDFKFPSSVYFLWNLHTLIVKGAPPSYGSAFKAPPEIWKMPQLRHVVFTWGLVLPDPPSCNVDRRDEIVLGNLQTLSNISWSAFGEEMIERIPNIKKLKIDYLELGSDLGRCNNDLELGSDLGRCNIDLDRLNQLQSFSCTFPLTGFMQNFTFPNSLRKLKLDALYTHGNWDNMLEKIGSLPLLEMLKLRSVPFNGHKWETVDGGFRSLKVLHIIDSHLEHWVTEGSHFPRLEHLVLYWLTHLEKIPSEIGEIPTLQSIVLEQCGHSVALSAKRILEEQEESGNDWLQVRVTIGTSFITSQPIPSPDESYQELKRLASPNFQVKL